MGKSKRKDKALSERRFKKKYCNRCRLCSDPEPYFCYSVIYKPDTTTFTTKVFPNLYRVSSWPDSELAGIRLFREIFCNPETCSAGEVAESCPQLNECITEFKSQTCKMNTSKKNNTYKNSIKKGKKHPDPVVTFMTNDNKEWIKRIEVILNACNH